MDCGSATGVSSGAVTGLADSPAGGKTLVFVCTNVDCRVRGASEVMERLAARVQSECSGRAPGSEPSAANGGVNAGRVNAEVRPYMCFGGCHDGPNVLLYPDKVWYAEVQPEDADRIVDQHLKKGETVTALTGKIDKGLEEMIFSLLDSGIY